MVVKHFFTIADSAFLVNEYGNTIWARCMPLGEGWVREFIKGTKLVPAERS